MNDVAARVRPRTRFPYLNVALFVATVATTVFMGAAEFSTGTSLGAGQLVVAGLPFAASIIGILLCHEMGHYLMARAYGVDSTLPFFIPVPFGIGTLGAVIRIRSAMPTRRAVLDIGAAGPIAGFLVAVPLFAWGLAHSPVTAVDLPAPSSFGSPYAMLMGELHSEHTLARLWALITGAAAPEARVIQLTGNSLVTWGIQKLVLGNTPPGYDVLFHPVAAAAWFGLLVTTLNLVPLGQLDGGHVTYALLGRRGARLASRLVSWFLLFCGVFFSWSWLVWWFLTRFLVGPGHPPALEEEPLGRGGRALALLSLALFAVTFIPVPLPV